MLTRFECVSKSGYTTFKEKRSEDNFDLLYAVVDHLEKKVLLWRFDNAEPPTYSTYIDEITRVDTKIRLRLEDASPLEFEEWKTIRPNSYERELLVPLMTADCIIKNLKYFLLNNCQPKRSRVVSTYEEAVIHLYLPALLAKLGEKKVIPRPVILADDDDIPPPPPRRIQPKILED